MSASSSPSPPSTRPSPSPRWARAPACRSPFAAALKGFPFILGVAGLCLYVLRRLKRAPQIVFGVLLVWAAGALCASLIRFAHAITEDAFGDGCLGRPHPQIDWLDITPVFVILSLMILITGLGCGAMIFARRGKQRPMGAVCCGVISLPVFVLHILDMTHGFYIGPCVAALGCVLVIIGGIWELARRPRPSDPPSA